MQRFIGQYNQNDRNSFERCALSGPQKHIPKKSDGFHNHSTQLTMVWLSCIDSQSFKPSALRHVLTVLENTQHPTFNTGKEIQL